MTEKELIKMYKAGLISSKPYNYLNIQVKVNEYMATGITKTESVKRTATLLGVTMRTVWHALKATNGFELK